MDDKTGFAGVTGDDTAAAMLCEAIAQAPFAALLFRPDDKFTLLWRNHAHGVMSQSVGLEVTGRGMFEAFPPSDDADGFAAMQAIRDAVATMCATGKSTEIGPYRYDLKDADGDFVEYHWLIRMSPVVSDGKVTAVLQVAEDATRAVLDKRLAETLRRAAASTADISHFSFDPGTSRFERSAAVDRMFGFAPGEAGETADPFFARIHPEDREAVEAEVTRVIQAPRGEVAALDYRVPQADGRDRFVRVRAEMAVDPVDRKQRLVGTFVDLTDVESDRRQLQRELALREALVNEANHRIKNSLAIALAMLRMERQAVARAGADEPERAMAALSALESRIGAISGAHGLMQLQGNRTDVSLHGLLQELVRQVRAGAGVSESDLRLTLAGDDLRLHSDMATSLGMILNELITNSLKYGLDTDGRADISVTAEAVEDGTCVTVANAIEHSQPIAAISSSRLGSMLVQQLANDFGATVEAEPGETHYRTRVHLPASCAKTG